MTELKGPELIIIAAVSENGRIGFKNKVPWDIPEDRRRFKELTVNHPVIMGRRTYESVLERIGKPLPERKNIVLSNNLNGIPGIYIARNIREAINFAEGQDTYVIGGERVYRDFMHLTSRMEITRIHKYFEGDAFFPEINEKEWNIEKRERKTSKEDIPYSFWTYNRR